MNFKTLATQVLMRHVHDANNSTHAAAALDRLAGNNKAFDLNELVDALKRSHRDVAGKTISWLGDGENESVSAAEIEAALGTDRIAAFAQALGVDRQLAAHKLTQILPELIDQSSQAGSILGSEGRKRGLAGLASRLLRQSA